MSSLVKGIFVAVVQVALVVSVGAKFWYDRATLPRVWVRAAPYDPNLPIRGRYVRLQLVVHPVDLESGPALDESSLRAVELYVEDGRLTAEVKPSDRAYDASLPRIRMVRAAGERLTVLDTPVPFFIPEDVPDPSRRAADEELWVETTIPRQGPPRPIRLGVRKQDGPIQPLELE